MRWVVRGRVQGVGYRWFTLRTARALGLAGWATNLPDGRVEIVAAGAEDALEQLEAALQAGPTMARIESVEKHAFPHDVNLSNPFSIK